MNAPDHRPETRAAAPLIEAEQVGLTLGGREILAQVDLKLRPAEIVTVIGPNGAGKTMLLRVLLGLVVPTSGQVRRRSDLTVGYLPQHLTIDPVLPLTVARLLALPGPVSEATRREALQEVGGSELYERDVQKLSGGELRRVLLARALLRDPQLLVMDEPLQGVDVGGQLELYELFGRLRRKRGLAVLMVSHDLHVVMAATDEVICLNGHVCCHGAPEAVSRHPEYAALFGPAAAHQLAVYAHDHDHSHDLHGEVVIPAAGDRVQSDRVEGRR